MFHYPSKPINFQPIKPDRYRSKPINSRLIKPERFSFPHVALVDFGPLWQLAETNFDQEMRRNPDAMASAVATTIPLLNDLAERGCNDLVLTGDMRSIHIAEQSSGAVEAAATGKGILGRLVRHLWKWAAVPDAERVARLAQASQTRRHLHNVHQNKAFQLEREARRAAIERDAEFRRKIRVMNANIQIDVDRTIEYRGLSNVGPMKDVGYTVAFHQPFGPGGGCVPIPIRNAHERSGTGWAARNHHDQGISGSHRRETVNDKRPIPAALEFRGDRPIASPESIFDHSPIAARVATHKSTEHEKLAHGVANEGLALHGEIVDSVGAELEEGAVFKDSDENVVSFPKKKRIKHYEPVTSKVLITG